MSILKRQVISSPNFASLFRFMKDNSYVLFLAQTRYTLLKRSAVKQKVLRILASQVKTCEIPYANFETASRFLSKFSLSVQFHER